MMATRYLFFTGKGGVGKTSLSCATAVRLATEGRRVLLVSTDPASNLDDVLAVSLGPEPRPIPGEPNLFAANLDPEAAAAAYREKVVGPYRGLLPNAAIVSMEEQLSGACTVEIAAFDEFARLLGNPAATEGFDHVVFDTAPTGHTLRLLSLPSAWDGFLETSTEGASCLGPLAGLAEQRELYHAAVRALADPTATTLMLVSRAEPSSLAEADRASRELAALGLKNQCLLLNGLFVATDPSDEIAVSLQARGRAALEGMSSHLRDLPRTEVPLAPFALIGVAALHRLLGPRTEESAAPTVSIARKELPPPLSSLIDRLAADGPGVIMTMGKGGVGKTTVAAAVAVELARRGNQVHLSTTDPAAHVQGVVDGAVTGLTVSRIDPKAEVAAYTHEILSTAGRDLDKEGRALLEEDLRSPCTEEIAVFHAFARAVDHGKDGFVVLDTAPTGHTILLLDAAQAYHREVSRKTDQTPEAVRELLPRLRDRAFTRLLLVTLPEATPVYEAERLQSDLHRAGITPFAWVINQSFLGTATRDSVLRHRAGQERQWIERLGSGKVDCYLVPWLPAPPAGTRALGELIMV
jgi:arsenite-transporting ATPase